MLRNRSQAIGAEQSPFTLGGVVPKFPSMLEQQYSNPFRTPSERMGEPLTRGLTPIAPQESTSINEGPVNIGIAGTQTAIQRGLQPIQTPRGTLYATEQQASNVMTPRTLDQQGTRTPEQQQALLAQMRERGAAIAQNYTQTMQNFAAERRANPQSYTTPLGASITAPTNRFGQPIAGFQQQYAQREQQMNDRRATSAAMLAATPFGRSQQNQPSSMMVAGGPQPAATPTMPRPSTAGPSTMSLGMSPFSYTPFSQRMEQSQPSPLGGFMAAINPEPVDRRFRPLPFGLRQFGTV